MASYNSFKKIETESIVDGAITGNKFADNSITSTKFASGSVRTTDIEDEAVNTLQISNTLDLSSKTMTYRAIIDSDIAATSVTNAKLASGMVTSRLGYTPVNRAGDTIDSNSRLIISGGGTAANPTIQSKTDANTGIILSGTKVSIVTAGSERLVADATSGPREPSRPAFQASGNGGWYYANSFGGTGSWRQIDDFTWNVIQQGGSNCASTGLFTAPVAGYYHFYAQTYWYNDNNNTAGYTHWNIGINGSPTPPDIGRTPHTIYSHGVPNNYTPGIRTQLTLYMNASVYAVPQPYFGGASGRMHGNHSLWCGFLIG